MEARSVAELPVGDEWQYEPKWDGFRCLVFREGENITLQSKAGLPLARYFPEVVEMFRSIKAPSFILDGEVVIPIKGRLSFDDLLMRIHPAESRVKKLAAEFPATVAIFDLLKSGAHATAGEPLASRRPALEKFADRYLSRESRIRLSPATTDVAVARRWFKAAGRDLDGIIAKRRDLAYQFGTRDGMLKIKKRRTADCVVGGFRYATGGKRGSSKQVGSLLLGLFDARGLLHHVGFKSSFKAADRPATTKKVLAQVGGTGFTGRAPGGPSRWSTKRSTEWVALKPKLVVEVEFDHFTGGRFRHGTHFLRWRPDKPPKQCTLTQVGTSGAILDLGEK